MSTHTDLTVYNQTQSLLTHYYLFIYLPVYLLFPYLPIYLLGYLFIILNVICLKLFVYIDCKTICESNIYH